MSSTPGFSADGRVMAALSGLTTVRVYALPSGRPLSEAIRYGTDISDIVAQPGRAHDRSHAAAGRRRRDPRRALAAAARDAAGFRDAVGLPALHARRALSHGRELEGLGAGCGRPRPASRSAAGSPATPGASTGCRSAPNGRTLATGGPDGTIRLWDLRTQQPLGAPCRGCPTGSSSRSSAPDGAYLFAIYGDGAGARTAGTCGRPPGPATRARSPGARSPGRSGATRSRAATTPRPA